MVFRLTPSLLLCVSCESSIHPSIPLSTYLPISLSHSLFGPLSVSIYVCARYLREFYASHAFRGLNFSVLVDAAADWGPSLNPILYHYVCILDCKSLFSMWYIYGSRTLFLLLFSFRTHDDTPQLIWTTVRVCLFNAQITTIR